MKNKLEKKTIALIVFNVAVFVALAAFYISQIVIFNQMNQQDYYWDAELKLQFNTVGALTTWFLNQCGLLLESLLVYYVAKAVDKSKNNKKQIEQDEAQNKE